MEHTLCECLHYAQLLWVRLGEVITKYLNSISTEYIPKVEYSQLNIIYNVPHPSILIHIPDKLSRNTLLMLTQEIKRDIIFRRLNLPPSARLITETQRLAAHLNSTFHQLHSYLQYLGLAKYVKATTMLQKMMEINLEALWWCRVGTASCPLSPLPLLHLLLFMVILKSWHKMPNPCQSYNTRPTRTLSDAQLYNSEVEHTCPQIYTAENTAHKGGGRVTEGGAGLPCHVHMPSEYQIHVF